VFQSPSGVLGVCRALSEVQSRTYAARFQSPSGVLGVCRKATWTRTKGFTYMFQSPSGVLGVCRQEYLTLADTSVSSVLVSVPFRGFRGLQGKGVGLEDARVKPGFSPLPGF